MGSWKAGGNSTSPPEITTSESSGSTRNRAGESILGPARRATCTRVNSKRASATAEAPSGGPTAAGTKASSERESKAAGAYSSAREDTASTRATGHNGMFDGKGTQYFEMASGMRAPSRRTSSMARGCSIRTIRLSMACGRITSCRWSIW